MAATQNLLWQGARARRVTRNGRRQNGETVLMAAVQRWIDLHPRLIPRAWRNNAGLARTMDGHGVVRLAPAGSPDIVGFTSDGRFIGIECKLAGEEPTPAQVEFLAGIHQANAIALVVHSVDELAEDVRRLVTPRGAA